MMRQQEKTKTLGIKEIAPRQVWSSMTDKEQAQFIQTIEAICQRLASQQMREKEGPNDVS